VRQNAEPPLRREEPSGSFTDSLPDDVFYALCFLVHESHKHLKEELRADRTYATATRCFLELIEDKKAKVQANSSGAIRHLGLF
jgi:hypothetical protein